VRKPVVLSSDVPKCPKMTRKFFFASALIFLHPRAPHARGAFRALFLVQKGHLPGPAATCPRGASSFRSSLPRIETTVAAGPDWRLSRELFARFLFACSWLAATGHGHEFGKPFRLDPASTLTQCANPPRSTTAPMEKRLAALYAEEAVPSCIWPHCEFKRWR